MFSVKLKDDYFYTSIIALGGKVVFKEWQEIYNDNLLPKAKRNPHLLIRQPTVIIQQPDPDPEPVAEEDIDISDAVIDLMKANGLTLDDVPPNKNNKVTLTAVRKVIKDRAPKGD